MNAEQNVFGSEIKAAQRDDSKAVYLELDPNECSLHDARVMHSSEPNTSDTRRCGSVPARFNSIRRSSTAPIWSIWHAGAIAVATPMPIPCAAIPKSSRSAVSPADTEILIRGGEMASAPSPLVGRAGVGDPQKSRSCKLFFQDTKISV